ncbi:death domain-associated protein 6-like isoform X2 [Portunus trituberculatus]|uniref:death domain-associated protein 6-like isoform X2 n=1 Tax=Portunus trituberculatus TaxID=210409 RepID=UPI001E1CDD75|nr:death domain-associated protein 6-like isoform X2 [Portunus trituberculatus]
MAATEVVELSCSDDEDFQEPVRKPIGWNYQLGATKTQQNKPRANGTSATMAPAPATKADDDDDDLEIIEINIDPKNNQSGMPSSSSRSEIRKQVRNASQSSISDFFTKKKSSPEDTSEKKVKKKIKESKSEEREEKQEENDRSTATLEEFIRRWEEIKISKDDEKIRDKLWKHYHLAQTSYTHSKKFIQIIEASTRKLTSGNIYVVIKDILDCLKQYKDMPYRQKGSEAESAGTSREGTPTPTEPENSKVNKRLRKVEKKMEELAKKIKELENQEVDLDDDDNSAYLVEDRIKRQFAKLHDYYCRVANCSTAIGRPIEKKFRYKGSRWVEINKRITAWVNKYKEFPDYVDILNLVKKVTKQSNLPLRPETVRVQAQEIFRDVGKILKYRRESDDLYSIYSYVEEEGEDPAKQDEALDQQLKENEKIASENLNKVFQDFVEKDGQQQESADVDTKTASDKTQTKNSPVKDVLSTTECKVEEEEKTVATESESKVKEEVKVGSIAELGVTLKRISDNCTENGDDETAENHDEYIVSDAEEGTSTEDHSMSDSEDNDDDDTSVEENEEDERRDTKEGNTHDVGKAEEELDDGDDTDDDLKAVLASACIDEEEEDSEEDISVIDTEEFLELEGSGGEGSSKNSMLCLDENSQECTATVENDTQECNPITSTAQNNNNHVPTTHNEEQNCTEQHSSTTTSVATPPKASVDTRTTSPTEAKQHEKRKLDESLSPCKKLCVSDA